MLAAAGQLAAPPPPGRPGTLLVLAIVTLPGLLSDPGRLFRKADRHPWRCTWRGGRACRGSSASLTHPGVPALRRLVSVDAVGRTLVRVLVTRRRLLEWRTSGDSEGDAARGPRRLLSPRCGSPPASACWARRSGWISASPASPGAPDGAAGLWIWRPVDRLVDQPAHSRRAPDLTGEQLAVPGRTARKTWHFFETFVTAENWLPPDNFQETPEPRIASRTSPTNMGLALLANLAARDLGYLRPGADPALPGHPCDDGAARAVPRALLQLVRHAHAEAPPAPLCLERRQRQPRGAPAHARLRAEGAGRREGSWPAGLSGLRDTLGVLCGLAPGMPRLPGSTPNWRKAPPACARHSPLLLSARRARPPRSPRDAGGGGEPGRLWARPSGAAARSTWRSCASSPRGCAALARGRRPRPQRLLELEAWPRRATSWPRWTFLSLRPRGTCSAPGSTSPSAGSTRDSTTCWPRRRGCAATSPSPWGRFPRTTGSRSAACWSPRGRAGPRLVERLDVRVPDAAAGDADYENTLLDQTCRAAVRQQIDYGAARRAVGHLRVGLQPDRRPPELPVPRLRRAGPGPEAGSGRRSGDRPYATALALMVRPGRPARTCSGCAPRGTAPTASTRRRLHARALPPGTRRALTIRSFMAHHQGMSLLALTTCCWTGRCSGGSWPDPCSRRRTCCCRSASQGRRPRAARRTWRKSETRGAPPATRERDARLHQPGHAGARGPPAFQRPVPRRGHQRGRRVQPLARPGGHPLARGPTLRLLGHLRAICATSPRASSGRRRYQPTRRRPKDYEAIFTQAAPNSAAATPASTSTPRSACRRRTTSSCAASRSRIRSHSRAPSS
jgi:hypothetical protein